MSVQQVDTREHRSSAGGQWQQAKDGRFFDVHEPYSGKLFARVAAGTRDDARIAVDAAADAFKGWLMIAPSEKARLFLKAAGLLCADELTSLRSWRARPVRRSHRRPSRGLSPRPFSRRRGGCSCLEGEVLETSLPGTHSIGVRRPLGVVASFTPWNGANILSWRAVISPVAAGNTVVESRRNSRRSPRGSGC